MCISEPLKITSVRHGWAENTPKFEIDRPEGHEDYVFVHLWNSVNMTMNGRTFNTEPSACVIYDKNFYQKWKPGGGGIIHDWIHISGDLPSVIKKSGLEFNRVYYPSSPEFITEICEELETEFFAEKEYGEELCRIGLEKLFYMLARYSGKSEAHSARIDGEALKKLKELRSELLSNLRDCMSAPEMARKMSVSESKFYVMYKSAFGISPAKDIINARIQRAKIYLRSGLYSVERTAYLLGYTNAFHFIRQFKQMVGQTPGEFARIK